MLQNGLGVVRSEQPAAQWMRAAAEQGHALAQHGLGFMYMEGDCVQQDGDEAVKWFERAAAQGLVGSQATLAQMYEQGTLIERDLDKARTWYRAAGFDDK